MSHLLRSIALVFLCWSTQALAHDVHHAYAPVGQAPVVQVPVVQNSVVNVPGYRDGRHRPRGSILGSGFRGLYVGALAGLGASYFVARDAREPGRLVALSTSIGALSGAGVGITLGVLDRMDVASAYYISRDLGYGLLFGAAIGALGGGIATLNDHGTEAILLGASAGSLAGLGLGLLTGIIEGPWRARHDSIYVSGRRVSLSLARVAPDPAGWGAQLTGSF